MAVIVLDSNNKVFYVSLYLHPLIDSETKYSSNSQKSRQEYTCTNMCMRITKTFLSTLP